MAKTTSAEERGEALMRLHDLLDENRCITTIELHCTPSRSTIMVLAVASRERDGKPFILDISSDVVRALPNARFDTVRGGVIVGNTSYRRLLEELGGALYNDPRALVLRTL